MNLYWLRRTSNATFARSGSKSSRRSLEVILCKKSTISAGMSSWGKSRFTTSSVTQRAASTKSTIKMKQACTSTTFMPGSIMMTLVRAMLPCWTRTSTSMRSWTAKWTLRSSNRMNNSRDFLQTHSNGPINIFLSHQLMLALSKSLQSQVPEMMT